MPLEQEHGYCVLTNIMKHIISALTAQKHNHQRINVFLDGEFAFGLSRIVGAWLNVGKELDDVRIAEILADDARETANQITNSYISYRPRTETEIRNHLQKKDIPDQTINEIVNRLKEIGIINDQIYTQRWIESRLASRPRGRRGLQKELRQRGIPDNMITQALDKANIDEEQIAFQAAEKQIHKYQNLDRNTFRNKLSRYLLQRGFSYDAISNVVSRVWEEFMSGNIKRENHLIEEENL